MEFKGTKGKWYLSNSDTILRSENGSEICDYSGYKTAVEEDKANALLISKAPEMLEMLNECYKYFNINCLFHVVVVVI